ncbi:MAG: trypsin-like peptidase domain-containing protein [Fluviicoccus sp.]|nr:trypsin-like peptidase domain-containing protein [Fluviicoccus sp.]MDO8329976.1 trypsin-like peptidase domain-containing protein [Fluviicoccus sp.]
MNKHPTRLLLTGSALILVLSGCQPKEKAANESNPPPVALSQERPAILPANQGVVVSYADTVRVAAPAVVNIYTTETVKPRRHPLMDDPFFRRFFENQNVPDAPPNTNAGLGSGVIVSTDGYILTNNHVVSQAGEIIVALHDGRKAKAKVIGTDPESDLAVIRIDLKNLPALPFKASPNQVGDVVLAIGNPFGVGQTVTQGIISALGRNGLGINTYEDFIQTDAAINPGNSGGALIDVAGNLVGINSAIYSRSGGSLGIGFAIPAKLAQQVMLEIIQHGQVVRGWLGVEVKQGDSNFSAGVGEVTAGVEIAGVVHGGPADEAGIQSGDIILTIDGQKVTDAGQLINRIGAIKPDSRVTVRLKRERRGIDIVVTVAKRPQADQRTEE